ncbi:MAG TPA: DUF3344 domain-containing protein [Methanoregulaceae archaeon]|nr:DUF3344 domain-containing protein [Methanoregulaceae archaeon]
MKQHSPVLVLLVLCLLFGTPGSALYDFSGIPLEIVAQGEIDGHLQTFGTYGVQDPPATLVFEVAGEVQWARTYVGVWGGTPRYTGWTDLTVNDRALPRITLYGSDDRSGNVYVSGYGVYWVAYDTTALLESGSNRITADTSRFEPDNKLDGRIYCLVTLVAERDATGLTTRYFVAEGNENLHGEGWSGTIETTNDACSVTLPVGEIPGVRAANLTVLTLASTRGEPSYVLFNSHDLGPDVDYPGYPPGVRDIADETSFNAGLYAPVPSRYVDIEVFDVLALLREGENTVTFQRGRDLSGDGMISASANPPEGEHYLHPVLAMLTLERERASVSGPDLALSGIAVQDAHAGEEGAIIITIRNLGAFSPLPAELRVRIDGDLLATRQVTLDRSGLQQAAIPWSPGEGSFAIQAEVDIPGDSDPSNNRHQTMVTVGGLPDLAVSLEPPVRRGDAVQQGDPFLQVLTLAGAIAISLLFLVRRPPQGGRRMLGLLLSALVILALLPPPLALVPPVAGQDTSALFLLPVTVSNLGGSDAPAFAVSMYLDGERVITKEYLDGMQAGRTDRSEIPLYTSPGSHHLRVVIDENGLVRDADRSNNSAEATYVFT